MNRQTRTPLLHGLIPALWFGLLPMLVSPHSTSAKSLAGSRPNIILVMTDDQGMGDLSCLGNQVLRTPHLDRFYALATRFTDFHVSPTCAPTRSALMSGRHEFRNGVTHTILERERMALSTTTFPQLLQQAGYSTGIFGKWHLGDEDAYQPYHRGFDEVFIHGAGGIGQSYPGSCADFPPNQNNRYFDIVALHNDTIVQTAGFCTDVFFQAALDWIKQQPTTQRPFFAYISTNAPHGPMIAPGKYKQRFADLGWDEDTQGRYGMIENIDDNFGLLLEKLNEWDLSRDTLLIFMTDNGQAALVGQRNGQSQPLHTAGFKTGKGTVYEGGTHVPAFWRWPGVLGEGQDISALTAHIDLFPTICELAGAELSSEMQSLDGRSLLPLLEDPQADWPDRTLFVHRGRWEKGADPDASKYDGCAVRSQRWRLVNHNTLYDIAADPYETTDVAGQHPQVVADLRGQYDAWWQATRPLLVNEGVPLAAVQPQPARYQQQLAERGIPRWQPTTIPATAKAAWQQLVGPNRASAEAFAWVENDPALPNVLIYGDSISIGYTPFVRHQLMGKANVYRLYCNGEDSGRFVDKMRRMHTVMRNRLRPGYWSFAWDMIHFNVGLHDLKYVNNGGLDLEDGQQVRSVSDYAAKLREIIAYLGESAPQARLIFATTTPVPEGAKGRVPGDAQRYNETAIAVLQDHPQIIINDLYGFTKPHQAAWCTSPDNVHFNETGKQAQGDEVARAIMAALDN